MKYSPLNIFLPILIIAFVSLWGWMMWLNMDVGVSGSLSSEFGDTHQMAPSVRIVGWVILFLCTISLLGTLYAYRRMRLRSAQRSTRIKDLLNTLSKTSTAMRKGSGHLLAALAVSDHDRVCELGSYVHTYSMQMEQIVAQLQSDDPQLSLTVSRRPIQIRRLITDCIRDLDITYSDIKHLFSIDVQPADLTIHVDPYYMKVALHHLLDNTIRYNQDEKRFHVEITVYSVADRVHIVISDNGVGVQKHHVQHLGKRFYRAGRGKKDPLGLGLGLLQTSEVIAAHGGQITYSSDYTAGFRAEIVLPQALVAEEVTNENLT